MLPFASYTALLTGDLVIWVAGVAQGWHRGGTVVRALALSLLLVLVLHKNRHSKFRFDLNARTRLNELLSSSV